MERVKRKAGSFILMLWASGAAFAQAEMGPRISASLAGADREDVLPVWIYFTDKGPPAREKPAIPLVSELSLRRRQNVSPAHALVDETDLPVEESYLSLLTRSGVRIRHRSRWLNAVSAMATPSELEKARHFPFVSRIELLGRYARGTRLEREPAPPELLSPSKTSGTHTLDYGGSFTQVSQINVPFVHDSGNFGQGVLVGMFDDGFRLLGHNVFDSLQVVATYDFVDGKENVAPNPPGSFLGDHGINTLSTIGGYSPGALIGPAFGASFLLARTEDTRSETPLEEDNWVAAMEWADSIGVQVTSTSLGYLDYDDGFTDWTWEDMDGRTTVISRAAVMAARKGIVVVNSAGNEGFSSTHNTLGAPADADSVLTVGAVTPGGTRAPFSSVGPTTDSPPRIKPDVMAQGTVIFAASAYDPGGYALVQGTSFSCPLVAGVAALLVAARPTATPQEIIVALRNTASRALNPDNQYGWGIINALAAVEYLTGTGTGNPPPLPGVIRLEQNYPNPFNPGTTIRFTLPEPASVTVKVFDLLGREVRMLVNGNLSAGVQFTFWDGVDKDGAPSASGVYFARLEVRTHEGPSSLIVKMMLVR